jgi:opacity protein-like surface antigen
MALTTWLKKIFCSGCLAALLLVGIAHPAVAEQNDEWLFDVTLYGWYSNIDGTVEYPGGPGSGRDFSIDASNIIGNLELVLMGGFEARRNRLSMIIDGIYLDTSDSATTTVVGPSGTPVIASAGLDLTTWIVSTGVGYDMVHGKRGTLALFGGVRYLNADVDATLTLQGVPATRSESNDIFDGIVGLRGSVNLGEHWYIPYHTDVGTGESDLTWQLFAGIGYRFDWGNIRLGYRYLAYEQDDDKLMRDLEISGPVLGVGFHF